MKKQIKGSLSIIVATVIWGTAFVAQSIGMDHIGPFTFQAVRCLMAVLVLLPIIAVSDKLSGKNFWRSWCDPTLWKAGFLCGTPLFIAVNLQQMGIVDTDAGKSAFLTAMYIVFVPILGIFRGQKPSKWIPISVALAVVGLYFLSCAGVTAIATADLLLLGCALAFALQILCVDMFANKVDCIRLNCISSLLCAALSGAVMFLTETPTWEGIGNCIGPLAYAGCLSMGIAYSLQMIGQRDMHPATASLLMSMESVFAVLAGWLILGERLTPWEGLGCALVLIAVVLSQIPDRKKTSV
ncbi:MAG: DMT family transporter [Oscillospiraceae bacterium]|nr:DMT family transporter [Oscillospiraceae bacterium]